MRVCVCVCACVRVRACVCVKVQVVGMSPGTSPGTIPGMSCDVELIVILFDSNCFSMSSSILALHISCVGGGGGG